MTDSPASPPPGWHPGPSGSGGQRWWDGLQWTDQTRPLRISSDWRGWLARSPKAAMVARVIAGAAGLCAAGAFLVGMAALVREKPLDGVAVLLVPAIPTLAVGQLWAIALITSRTSERPGGWRDRMRAGQATMGNPRAFFFGDLPWRFGGPLLGLAFLGWLSAMTAFPALSHGGPAGAGDGCPYRLSSHGSYTCVSLKTYEHAGAGEQRFASGILLGFFAIQTGAALGGLHRRKAV